MNSINITVAPGMNAGSDTRNNDMFFRQTPRTQGPDRALLSLNYSIAYKSNFTNTKSHYGFVYEQPDVVAESVFDHSLCAWFSPEHSNRKWKSLKWSVRNAIRNNATNTFCKICATGRVDVAKWMISLFGNNIDMSSGWFTAVCLAVWNGHINMVKWLYEFMYAFENMHACNVSLHMSSDMCERNDPFCLACEAGHLRIAKLIQTKKMHLYANANRYSIALRASCANGRRDVVRWIIERQIIERRGECAKTNGRVYADAFCAACTGYHFNTAELLLKQNVNIGATDEVRSLFVKMLDSSDMRYTREIPKDNFRVAVFLCISFPNRFEMVPSMVNQYVLSGYNMYCDTHNKWKAYSYVPSRASPFMDGYLIVGVDSRKVNGTHSYCYCYYSGLCHKVRNLSNCSNNRPGVDGGRL